MSFVGEGEHLLVASAVAKCLISYCARSKDNEGYRRHWRQWWSVPRRCDAPFLAIAVVALELAGKSAVNHFYLGA